MSSIRQQVYKIISKTYKVPKKSIKPSLGWESHGVDSLSLVELLLNIKDHFRIPLIPKELAKLRTVNDLVLYVESKIRTKDI